MVARSSFSDVVKVVDSWEDEDTYSRSNKVPSVMVLVRKQSKTNTVDVVDGVNASMEQMMENDLPKDIKVDVVRDQSAYIRENVADVWNAILFGGFLALLITYMFLRDFGLRSSAAFLYRPPLLPRSF